MEVSMGDEDAKRAGRPHVDDKWSWPELKKLVKELRQEAAGLAESNVLPNRISFGPSATATDGAVRIYYLDAGTDAWLPPLMFLDVSPDAPPARDRLSGQPVPLGPGETSKMPRPLIQQQQQQPKPQQQTWGSLNSYHVHSRLPALLLPVQSHLYVLEYSQGWGTMRRLQMSSRMKGEPECPSMCPSRPSLVAYCAGGDLWLTDHNCNFRLTYACKGTGRLSDDPYQAGYPCYVMQEEFSRYTGFWWQPVKNDKYYRILYEEVDESSVKIFRFPSYSNSNVEPEEFRFPRAGFPNAKSTLKIVQFMLTEKEITDHLSDDSWNEDDDQDKEIKSLQWLELQRPLEDLFPWMEYIVRTGWTPCGNNVWCQIMDRRQQRLELILIPAQNFSEPSHYENCGDLWFDSPEYDDAVAPPEWSPIQVLISEQTSKWTEAWVNVHDILYFLTKSESIPSSTISFIWASEQTGHLHLYLITAILTQKTSRTLRDGQIVPSIAGPNVISTVLTQGDWEVIGKKIWVDEIKGLVYFIGLRETPLERHLYCVSYRGTPGEPQLLTKPGYSYNVDINEDCTVAVCTYSNLYSKPVCRVYSIEHSSHGSVSLKTYGSFQGSASPTTDWPLSNHCSGSSSSGSSSSWKEKLSLLNPPELYSCRVDGGKGEEIHAMVFRPGGGAALGPRPTLLHVYGGPVVQTVTNTFKGMRQLRMHMLAARGYCVVCIDSRGSKHRGVKFESHIRCKMGTVELQDQIEVLRWLAEKTGCIDLNRVAVHGWSYGGYLSLMGLAQYPDVFKVCVACAPVTCWRLYDTAYTERYMDLPHLNTDGYAKGSVIRLAERFPDQENRLLIVHGLQDENVHFIHTQQLIESLVRAGKPYQLQVYPGERHSLRHLEASAHYEVTLLSFLQNNL